MFVGMSHGGGAGKAPFVGQGKGACFEPDPLWMFMGHLLVLLASWPLEI